MKIVLVVIMIVTTAFAFAVIVYTKYSETKISRSIEAGERQAFDKYAIMEYETEGFVRDMFRNKFPELTDLQLDLMSEGAYHYFVGGMRRGKGSTGLTIEGLIEHWGQVHIHDNIMHEQSQSFGPSHSFTKDIPDSILLEAAEIAYNSFLHVHTVESHTHAVSNT